MEALKSFSFYSFDNEEQTHKRITFTKYKDDSRILYVNSNRSTLDPDIEITNQTVTFKLNYKNYAKLDLNAFETTTFSINEIGVFKYHSFDKNPEKSGTTLFSSYSVKKRGSMYMTKEMYIDVKKELSKREFLGFFASNPLMWFIVPVSICFILCSAYVIKIGEIKLYLQCISIIILFLVCAFIYNFIIYKINDHASTDPNEALIKKAKAYCDSSKTLLEIYKDRPQFEYLKLALNELSTIYNKYLQEILSTPMVGKSPINPFIASGIGSGIAGVYGGIAMGIAAQNEANKYNARISQFREHYDSINTTIDKIAFLVNEIELIQKTK